MAETKTDKIEREYIINIRRKVNIAPIYKRAPKAIRSVKEFLARHMKVRDRDLNKIRLDRYLNEYLWARGIRNPQTKIKVKAVKEGDIVRAELAELPNALKFKKLREEKREQKGAEIAKKKKEDKKTEEAQPNAAEAEEKKEEEKEKKSAVVEAGAEMEKAAKQSAKHEAKKTKNQPKRQFRQALQK